MQSALKVGGSFPNEGPNSIRLAHNDIVDFATRKVFVGGASHLEILAEEHDLEGGVCSVSDLDHLEAEVLPDGMG